jgi:OFA family oxalate/formate antiporter-like MFS transporter
MSARTANALPGNKAQATRWIVLIACVVAMMATANLQFAWTLFTVPLTKSFHTSLAVIQVTFTIFVLVQTWLVPIEAFLVDKVGARVVVSVAALFVGASWIFAGMAHSLTGLYIAYAIGGVGAGTVYGACVGQVMKWFPDRRGLCVGIVTGAFGSGTVFTIIPISNMIDAKGYAAAFITFGIIQGVITLLAAQFMKLPAPSWEPAGLQKIMAASKVQQSARNYTPREMLKTGTFYLIYLMMTLVAFGGLTVTAQLKPIGVSYGFDKIFLFAGISVVNMALLLDRVIHGFTRPFWGWLSDRIGRYNTMGIAFTLEACAVAMLTLFVHHPLLFVILSGFSFFAWGEIYSLFPTIIADVFGNKYATTNYGIQYTAKGVASLLAGPGAALLMAAAGGSWLPVLWGAVACDLAAASLAIFWLRPLVTRMISGAVAGAPAAVPAVATGD